MENILANMKKVLVQYNELTDNNNHNEAAMLLVKHFGTKDELEILIEIGYRHEKAGHITPKDSILRNQISNKYCYQLKQFLYNIKN